MTGKDRRTMVGSARVGVMASPAARAMRNGGVILEKKMGLQEEAEGAEEE
jgi:hypothetical protein